MRTTLYALFLSIPMSLRSLNLCIRHAPSEEPQSYGVFLEFWSARAGDDDAFLFIDCVTLFE